MSRGIQRDVGGAMARRTYDSGHLASGVFVSPDSYISGKGPKNQKVSFRVRQVRLLIHAGRVTPKLVVGKLRYPIPPKKFTWCLKGLEESTKLPFVKGGSDAGESLYRTAAYIADVFKKRSWLKVQYWDLAIAQESRDLLRKRYGAPPA